MTTKPRNAWVHPLGALGIILAVAFHLTRSEAVGGMAVALLVLAGIGALVGAVRPAAAQAQPAATSLVGVQILHAGGISTVTEDLDHPQPRRTVAATDGHGRAQQLMVGVDATGRVVEACRPGEGWAGATAI